MKICNAHARFLATETTRKFRAVEKPTKRTADHRKDVLDRIKRTNRVDAPEADMRPVLPGREKLMAAVAHVSQPVQSQHDGRLQEFSERSRFLSMLSVRVSSAKEGGDLEGVLNVAREAMYAPYPIDRIQALRITAVSAIQTKEAGEVKLSEETILSRFASNGALTVLRRSDIGAVLDITARGMIRRSDFAAAWRLELLSRLLEVELRRGTYTKFIELLSRTSVKGNLPMALGMFHRALVVGKLPNAAMFNAVLESTFRAGDGSRARAVLAEMNREKVQINGHTLSILLKYTQTVQNVDSVFKLLKNQVAENRMRAKPGLALNFIRAYVDSAASKSHVEAEVKASGDQIDYVERCFSLVDWFYDSGVGVTKIALDQLLCHLARSGNAEGALRAWREMRRGWLGGPTRLGRRRLLAVVSQSELPSRTSTIVLPRLNSMVRGIERRRLRRICIAVDDSLDEEILGELDDGQDPQLSRDQAAVLHRWVRQGKHADAIAWIQRSINEGQSVDARVLLALLGRERGSPSACDADSPSATLFAHEDALEFVLSLLVNGHSVRTTDRARLVDRLVKTLVGYVGHKGFTDVVHYLLRLVGQSSPNDVGIFKMQILNDVVDTSELRKLINVAIRVTVVPRSQSQLDDAPIARRSSQ